MVYLHFPLNVAIFHLVGLGFAWGFSETDPRYYDAVPHIVQDVMDQVAVITGRHSVSWYSLQFWRGGVLNHRFFEGFYFIYHSAFVL